MSGVTDPNTVLENGQYWIDMINRIGFDSGVYKAESSLNLEVLSRYFDSTRLGMLRVFHMFDLDHDSNITFSEVGRGLRQQGMYTLHGSKDADDAFNELCVFLGGDSSSTSVRPPEFLAVLRNLRLAALLSRADGSGGDALSGTVPRAAASVSAPQRSGSQLPTGNESKIVVHEYRGDQLFTENPVSDSTGFLFSRAAHTLAEKAEAYSSSQKGMDASQKTIDSQKMTSSWASQHRDLDATEAIPHSMSAQSLLSAASLDAQAFTTWVHVHEPSRRSILCLAVKYGLDPRFVLDVVNLWRESARVDVATHPFHGGNVHLQLETGGRFPSSPSATVVHGASPVDHGNRDGRNPRDPMDDSDSGEGEARRRSSGGPLRGPSKQHGLAPVAYGSAPGAHGPYPVAFGQPASDSMGATSSSSCSPAEYHGARAHQRPLHSLATNSVEWFFVVVPVLRLTRASKNSVRPVQFWRRQVQRFKKSRSMDPSVKELKNDCPFVYVDVEGCNLAMFVSGSAESACQGSVLSFSSEWVQQCTLTTDPSKSASKYMSCPESNQCSPGYFSSSRNLTSTVAAASRSVLGGLGLSRRSDLTETLLFRDSIDATEQGSMGGGYQRASIVSATDSLVDDSLAMFTKVVSQLRTSYSRLRTGDSHTFMMKTLCDISEDYLLVAEAYECATYSMQRRLNRLKDNMPQRDIKRLQKTITQLTHIYRLVRPVMTVIETLSYKDVSPDAQLYVSDIKSNVSRFLEDIAATKESAKRLVEQFHQFGQHKTSSVLYVLTLVTTIFVPGQFLASVYGMNFTDPVSGLPSMPELTWKYGYMTFWCLFVTISSIVFTFYRRKEWI